MLCDIVILLLSFIAISQAFDISNKDNLVLYWGQEGGTLASVCADSNVDVVALAFLDVFFSTGNLPEINFAGSCNGPTFPGTNLLECTEIGQDIQTCQAAGKAVVLSLGGAVGTYGFTSSSQAQQFAQQVWDLFGEGTSSTRPFGSSVVDGFDLDIENNEPDFYSDFITELRSLFATGTKQYYITGAPQCPFPDASLGQALDAAAFDMVFVQFYNNPPCGVESSGFNFDTWQSWASSSPNPNVKIFVGVPGSSAAAGSGYIDSSALASIIDSVASQPNFGGVMMWDANQAFSNTAGGTNYADAAKSALVAAAGGSSGSSNSANTASVVVKSQTPGATSAADPPATTAAVATTQAPAAQVPSTFQTSTVVADPTTTAPIGNAGKQRVTTTVATTAETPAADPPSTSTAAADPPASTSSADPAATGSESCSAGDIDCVNGQFAQCVEGQYVLTSCPSGTTCTKIPIDGSNTVVTCDYITAPSKKLRRHNLKRSSHAHAPHVRNHVLVALAQKD